MSMRDYAVDDYGLVFNGNHLQLLASQVCDDYTEKDYDKNRYDYYEAVVDKFALECIGEFTGEAIYVDDEGSSRFDIVDIYNADSIYYLSLSEHATLFKSAYNSIDDIINEFKTKVGKYLPDNFQYRDCF